MPADQTALERAVQALLNRGYGERQAREILSLVRGEAWNEGYNRSVMVAVGAEPLVVSRFDVAMEPAPEEPKVLMIGCVAVDGRPVALALDAEARAKVAEWLAPSVQLTPLEQECLRFALELAADEMASRADEFNSDDEAALKSLRRLTGEDPRG
ncbi:hypothetical protein OHR86_22580 [Streptomyces sp. NBC_00441]|uniref:hypothetical protein n=1 Tax=Streptomyces sp. NBC_00441 TaxID=2975742 RepID=UPI002E2A1004|nr:hypothetical protein [Streptomyces sp. NBC_00441]